MALRILHLLDVVKPNSIPWFYNLVKHIPNANNILATWNFYGTDSEMKVIGYPLNEKMGESFLHKLYNKFLKMVRESNYPNYVKKKVGKIDLIHAHFAHVGWQDLKLKKLLNVPYIVSFYGYDYESIPYKYPQWKERYRQLFHEADFIIAEGGFGAQKLVEMGCPPEKVKVHRLGVEVDKIPYHEREKKEGELNLVQIAAIREKKGQVFTIKAFLKALEKCPNMSLTIVGEDQDLQIGYFRTLIPAKHADKIKFVDRIDFKRLYEYLEQFHVFIHPSCYASDRDCEGGAPIVLLDAQATGMPIISTTHCDIPDEVVNGVTGLLSPEKDVDKLANSIKYFYEMEGDDYHRFANKARIHIEQNYDIVKNSEALFTQCYVQILS